MPLFMDVHHKEVQGRYGVDHRQYWFDEASGKVERHISSILAKLGARSRSEVAAIAYRHGLVPTG
jgi:hypothetical protein